MHISAFTLKLNSFAVDIHSSIVSLKKYKKYGLKKIIAQRNASASRTGVGIDSLPTLTDLEERLVSVMGRSSFAEGDQQLSVPLIIPTVRFDLFV